MSQSFFLLNSACNLISTDGSHNVVNIGVEPKCVVKGLWRDRYSAWYHLVNTFSGAELRKYMEKLITTRILAEFVTGFLHMNDEYLA